MSVPTSTTAIRSEHMEELAKVAALPLAGEADPVPQSLLASFPEQAKTLGLLYDVSRELTSILDREELLRRITALVKKIVNYDVFTVLMWNERMEMLEGVFAQHYQDAIPSRFRISLNEGITGQAAAERRAIRVDDVRRDPRYVLCEACQLVNSELVVPLLIQDRLIGVLDLESATLAAFNGQHERMLVALGPFIAIALENSRLYQEARENQLRLQSDLDTAREIQLQLLPRGARQVPGLDLTAAYVPARELGGDFYDFLPYGEGRLALALGDVSGKGTAAALYGSMAIGMLREHAVEHSAAPAVMLAMLNRRLHSVRLEARFIALTFGLYDAVERTIEIANAGGVHPLLLRAGDLSEIPVDGIPLGIFPEAEYSAFTLALRDGDVVLLASDGILESENPEQEEFGLERLRSLLTSMPPDAGVENIAGSILRATDQFTGEGQPARDDRTLIVLRATANYSQELLSLPVIY